MCVPQNLSPTSFIKILEWWFFQVWKISRKREFVYLSVYVPVRFHNFCQKIVKIEIWSLFHTYSQIISQVFQEIRNYWSAFKKELNFSWSFPQDIIVFIIIIVFLYRYDYFANFAEPSWQALLKQYV